MQDMLVKLYNLPEINPWVKGLKDQDIFIRRAMAFEKHRVVSWVNGVFGGGWADECEISFSHSPISCFIAQKEGEVLGFACYNSTCKNFFGPTGVTRKNMGIGTALLLSCLHAMAADGYAYAIIGGVTDGRLYAKVAGAITIAGSSPGIYPIQPLKARSLPRQPKRLKRPATKPSPCEDRWKRE